MQGRIHRVLNAHGFGQTRKIDRMVTEGRVTVYGKRARPGQQISSEDIEFVLIDGKRPPQVWHRNPFCDALTEILDEHCPSRDEVLYGVSLMQRWSHYRHRPEADAEPESGA